MTVLRGKHSLQAKRELAALMRFMPTEAEAMLWESLRNNQLGHRFRRQITVWGFIVDFYCRSLGIAIEVDGSAHASHDVAVRDEVKEAALRQHGITVLRFDNEDVLNFPLPVIMRIQGECDRLALEKSRSKGVGFNLRLKPSRSSRSCGNVQNCTETGAIVAPVPPIAKTAGLCTTSADCSQLPNDRLITPAEYEQLMRKVVTLSRQRSMNFAIGTAKRSDAEIANDLRIELDRHMEKKRQNKLTMSARRQA